MTLGLPLALVDHVWQSTLFVVLVWLATMALRSNGARVRFWLWTAASIKFLVPLSMLVNLGERFQWRAAPAVMQPAVSFVMQDVLAPADVVVGVPAAIPHALLAWPWLALAVWCAGAVVMLLSWWRRWLPIRAALHRARTVQLDARYGAAGLAVMSSPLMPEPGVVGIGRQRLLLPEGLVERLSPEQLRALIAHERCHVRCHDNLTAAIHMAVETVFWFHPVVWWIERRLMEERERACDESVLASGSRPQDYAEGILEVCRQSVGLRLACVAGVSGSNLRARVEAIMRNEIGRPMTRGRRWVLALAVGATVIAPVIGGALTAQSQIVPRVGVAFEEVSLKRHVGVDVKTATMYFSGDADGRPGVGPDGRVQLAVATNVTARALLRFAFPEFREGRNVDHIEIENAPGWIDAERFDVVAKAPSRTSTQQLQEMLQSLLIERFKVKAHRGPTEVPIYALVLARQGSPGPGLTPSQIDCRSNSGEPSPCGLSGTTGRLTGRGVSMAGLVRALANHLAAGSRVTVDRLLVDRTDLSEAFDFTLQWTPDPVAAVVAPSQAPARLPAVPLSNAVNFLAALEQQLGLVIVPEVAEEPALIIDEIELPTLD
jgi:bla regulator protein blaR1